MSSRLRFALVALWLLSPLSGVLILLILLLRDELEAIDVGITYLLGSVGLSLVVLAIAYGLRKWSGSFYKNPIVSVLIYFFAVLFGVLSIQVAYVPAFGDGELLSLGIGALITVIVSFFVFPNLRTSQSIT